MADKGAMGLRGVEVSIKAATLISLRLFFRGFFGSEEAVPVAGAGVDMTAILGAVAGAAAAAAFASAFSLRRARFLARASAFLNRASVIAFRFACT